MPVVSKFCSIRPHCELLSCLRKGNHSGFSRISSNTICWTVGFWIKNPYISSCHVYSRRIATSWVINPIGTGSRVGGGGMLLPSGLGTGGGRPIGTGGGVICGTMYITSFLAGTVGIGIGACCVRFEIWSRRSILSTATLGHSGLVGFCTDGSM